MLFLCLLGSDLKEIASLIEAGAYAREVRRIVRAVRLTMALRPKLKSSALSQFLGFALSAGSDVHTRLTSYLPKVIFITQSRFFRENIQSMLLSLLLLSLRGSVLIIRWRGLGSTFFG